MTLPINQQLLGSGLPLGIQTIDKFSFNGWSMDNGDNIRVINSNHDDIGTIDFQTYNNPLEDGGGVLGKYYRTKTITITLSIKADNETEFNNLIDDIKYNTSTTEGLLKITINNVVRQWNATLTSLRFNRMGYNIDWCGNVELIFSCTNPHSYLEKVGEVGISQHTGQYSNTFIYQGKAKSYPILYLTMESGTASGMDFILNGYAIHINTQLTVGDVIQFNGDMKKVEKNNVEIYYSGPFTPLENGENVLTINNSGTYSGSLSYYVKYL